MAVMAIAAVVLPDPRQQDVRDQYRRAPEPKELVVLERSAHAQFIFETDQGERLLREIIRFLSESSPAPPS